MPRRSIVAQVGLRVPLLCVYEVGELQGISYKKYRGVVADEVPVALLGINFQGEAADIAFGIGCAALAGHSGKAKERFSLVANFGKKLGARIAGNIARDRKRAKGAGALRMHHPLGDALAVEMGHLLDQPEILHEQWTARTGGEGILIVGDGCAGGGGPRGWLLSHREDSL